MNEKKHEVRPDLGITPELAAQLDRAAAEFESGDPEGNVRWDESSETWSNIHPADQGYSSHVLHKGISSNEQILFASLVEREKNRDPEIEHSEAYDRAVEKFDAMKDDEEDADA